MLMWRCGGFHSNIRFVHIELIQTVVSSCPRDGFGELISDSVVENIRRVGTKDTMKRGVVYYSYHYYRTTQHWTFSNPLVIVFARKTKGYSNGHRRFHV